jgi:hypothetical protein
LRFAVFLIITIVNQSCDLKAPPEAGLSLKEIMKDIKKIEKTKMKINSGILGECIFVLLIFFFFSFFLDNNIFPTKTINKLVNYKSVVNSGLKNPTYKNREKGKELLSKSLNISSSLSKSALDIFSKYFYI